MRFVSYRRGNGGNGFGTVKGDAIVDLSERLGSQVRSLKAALAQGVLQEAQAIGEAGETGPGLGEVELLPPIPVPEKIICIGVNYGDRNAEYRDASAQPKLPSVFLRTPDSWSGMGHRFCGHRKASSSIMKARSPSSSARAVAGSRKRTRPGILPA